MLYSPFASFLSVVFILFSHLLPAQNTVDGIPGTFDTIVYGYNQSVAVLVKDQKVGLLSMEDNRIIFPCEYNELQVNMGQGRQPWAPALSLADMTDRFSTTAEAYQYKNYSQLNATLSLYDDSHDVQENIQVFAAVHPLTKVLTVSIYSKLTYNRPYQMVVNDDLVDSMAIVPGSVEPTVIFPAPNESYRSFVECAGQTLLSSDTSMLVARPDFLFPGHPVVSSFLSYTVIGKVNVLPFYTDASGRKENKMLNGRASSLLKDFAPAGFTIPNHTQGVRRGDFNLVPMTYAGKMYQFAYETSWMVPKLVSETGKMFIHKDYYCENDSVGRLDGDRFKGNYILGVATEASEADNFLFWGEDPRPLYTDVIKGHLMDEGGGACYGLIKNGNEFVKANAFVDMVPPPYQVLLGEGILGDSLQCCDSNGKPIAVIPPRTIENHTGVYNTKNNTWVLEPRYTLVIPYKTGYYVMRIEERETKSHQFTLVCYNGYFKKGKWVVELSDQYRLFFEGDKLYKMVGEKFTPVKG